MITNLQVTGTVNDATGKPLFGSTVTFTLSAAITDGSIFVEAQPVEAGTNDQGVFTTTLYANDDPTTTPTGTYYNVIIIGPNGAVLDRFAFSLPHTSVPPVNIFSLPVHT